MHRMGLRSPQVSWKNGDNIQEVCTMRNKKQELNDILSKYDSAVQKVYQKVLSQEKNIKNIRKAQMKSLIDKEIMGQVQKYDN